jgi:tetratricopeptide (TPR) repeat protein
MNRPELRLVAGCVLAVAVPAMVLHFTAGEERLAAGLTAPPFAWPRLLVAQLATALPLGLIVGRWVRSLPAVRATARGLWVAGGVIVAGFVAMLGPGLGEAIESSEPGPVPLLFLRSLLALALVLPWCVAALDAPPANRPAARPGMTFGLGLGLALVPCGMYAEAMIAARTKQAVDLVNRGRLVRAEVVVSGLRELGSDQPIAAQSPAELGKGLAAAIPKLRQAADRPLPASAPTAARLNRALTLIQLDRLNEAAALLRPFTPAHTDATLLLASVYRDQQRWDESDALYNAALERLLPTAATDAAARADCLIAFEGLVFNARERRRPAEAERLLMLGLDTLPPEAAHFHFQLGTHYADGGRPAAAIEHLRTASALDPARFQSQVNDQLRQIGSHTPGCLLPGSP